MQSRVHLFNSLLLTFCAITFSHAQGVGIGTTTPVSILHVAGSTDPFITVQNTAFGGLQAGLDLLRYTEFGGTDWRIVNDGGVLKFLDGTDNFISGGELNMLLTQSGNFGLGTDSPQSHMHIAGTGDQFLKLQRTTTGVGMAGVDLLRGSEFNSTDWRIANDGGILKFLDGIDNFMTEGELNMVLTQGGNLGLGTDSPQSHMHIAGTGDQFLKVHRTTTGTGMAGVDLLRGSEFNSTDWRITNDGGVLKFLDGTDNFVSGGELNMVLTQGGFVGIGTEDPAAPLHVTGTTSISETGHGFLNIGSHTGLHLRFDANEILARNGDNPALLYLQYWSGNLSLCYNDQGRVGIGTVTPSAKVHITDGGDVSLTGGGELVLGNTNTANLGLDGNEIQARNNGSAATLFLQTSGGDILLAPNELGQVGIGVASSANMPDDEYLLAVDGKIISEEVRVELSGSWPDYVFDDEYPLISLSELEKHILTHGHLPGIPSAQTVETEGIELGNMQRMLLEKIEELTLYVIDLRKEVDDLKNGKH